MVFRYGFRSCRVPAIHRKALECLISVSGHRPASTESAGVSVTTLDNTGISNYFRDLERPVSAAPPQSSPPARLILDISRLVHAAWSRTPERILRVELAQAAHFLTSGPDRLRFTVLDALARLRIMHDRLARAFTREISPTGKAALPRTPRIGGSPCALWIDVVLMLRPGGVAYPHHRRMENAARLADVIIVNSASTGEAFKSCVGERLTAGALVVAPLGIAPRSGRRPGLALRRARLCPGPICKARVPGSKTRFLVAAGLGAAFRPRRHRAEQALSKEKGGP